MKGIKSVAVAIPWDAVALMVVAASSVGTLASAAYESEIRDADKASKCTLNASIQKHISQSVVDSLNSNGYVVVRNILSEKAIADAQSGTRKVRDQGRMKASTNDKSTRQDNICWVRASDGFESSSAHKDCGRLNDGLLYCIELLRGVAGQLEKLDYTRSINLRVPKQCQLACYDSDGKARYKAHRDASVNDSIFDMGLLGWLKSSDYRERQVTAILYLNDSDWDCDPDNDGGALHCYLNAQDSDYIGNTASEVLKINPAGGTLVLFDSRYLLHEVKSAHRTRYAITLWITGDDAAEVSTVRN